MPRHRALRATAITLAAATASIVLVPSAAEATSTTKPVTGLVSVNAAAAKTGSNASTSPSISSGGRYVAFSSDATDLIAGDTNAHNDVFVRDTLAASTVRVSVSSSEVAANGDSDQPAISSTGRFVAFRSDATNLVSGDTNGRSDIFVRDLWAGTTVRASLRDDDSQATGGDALAPDISSDGNEVVFQSDAANLVPFDLNAKPDVFVRTLSTSATEIVSVKPDETALTAGGTSPSMSADGRWVVFDSTTNQIGGDLNGAIDVFIRDRDGGDTQLASRADDESIGDAGSQFGSVSDDGRYVAWQSSATNLTSDATASGTDAFRRDRTTGTTILVNKKNLGGVANSGGAGVTLSADGSRALFSSGATNLTSGDTNGVSDIFLRTISAGTTVRVSQGTFGAQLDGLSFSSELSPDGTAATFTTLGANGFTTDDNETFDIYATGSFEQGPFASSLGLLQQAATDFDGTPLSVGAVVALNDKILYGVASPSSAIDDLAHGTFDDHRGPVMRLYWSFFHRIPDPGGLAYWVGKHEAGTSLKAIANAFAQSSEFTNTYGALTSTAFVALVYQNVLGRMPDAAGLAYWVGRLGAGVSRGEMMSGFSESSEGRRLMRAEVDSILVSLGMWRRLPTKPEFSAMVGLLEAGGVSGSPTEVLVRSVLVSTEYAARFV